MTKIPVEITARHLHLSQKDLERLFGKSYELKVLKKISQPGQFACKETLIIKGPDNSFDDIRVVGPIRKQTQVEISLTEARFLGIKAPLRLSGNIKKSGQAVLKGPKGQIRLKEGVIITKRHLHLHTQEAKKLSLKNNQKVSIRVGEERQITFHQVIVRAGEMHKKAVHLDTDEANASGLKTCSYGELMT